MELTDLMGDHEDPKVQDDNIMLYRDFRVRDILELSIDDQKLIIKFFARLNK